MITRFKIFEKFKGDLNIGDYVICNDNAIKIQKVKDFLQNNIGKIIEIGIFKPYKHSHFTEDKKTYWVKFENIPNDIILFFLNKTKSFFIEDIKYFSENKEDLEHIIDANKYNI